MITHDNFTIKKKLLTSAKLKNINYIYTKTASLSQLNKSDPHLI